MPSKCFVPGCSSNCNDSSKVRIFSFPRDEELKKNWLKAINRQDNREPSKFSKVCERHFLTEDIVTESNVLNPITKEVIRVPLQKHRLRPDAVPSIFTEQHARKRRLLPKPEVLDEHPVGVVEHSEDFTEEDSDMKIKAPQSISESDVSKGFDDDDDDEGMDIPVSEQSDLPTTTDRPFIEVVKLDNSKEQLTTDDVFDDNSPLKSSPISKPNSASKSPSSSKQKHFLPSPYKHLQPVSVLLKPEDKTDIPKAKRSLSTCSGSSIGSNEASRLQPKRRKVEKPAPTVLGQANDGYCWVCHRENVVLSCLACPRAYHQKCVGESGIVSSDWVCPECQRTLTAENVDSRSSVLSEISLDKLCTLLRFSLNKMKHRAGVAFLQPVSLEHYPMYLHYVIHPMDFSLLEKNIKEKRYGCTEAFLSDLKWIYHNSCVFNGTQHPLSTNAKSIVKACEIDMQEIEVCPDCFMHNIVRHKYWFSEVCQKPHPLVWAKLKGFPHWPAKVVRIVDGNVDARFFGAHDRAWVPISQCYHLSKEMPVSSKPKKKGYETALDELNVHVQLLIQKYGNFQYAPYRTVFNPENKHLAYHGINIDLVAINQVQSDIASTESNLLKDVEAKTLALHEVEDITEVANPNSNETLSTLKPLIEKDNANMPITELSSEAGQSSPKKSSPTTSESLHRKKIEMALQRIKGYVTNDLEDEEKDSSKEKEEEASSEMVEDKQVTTEPNVNKVASIEKEDSLKLGDETKSEPKESTIDIPDNKDEDSSDREDNMCLADLIKARTLPPIDLPTFEDATDKETPAVLEPTKKNDSFSLKLLETIESCKAKLGISSDLEKSDSESEDDDDDVEEEESEIEERDRDDKGGSNENSIAEDASDESTSDSDDAESVSSNTDIETLEESEATGVEKPSEEDPLDNSCNSLAEVSQQKTQDTEKEALVAPETEKSEMEELGLLGKEVQGSSEKEVSGPSVNEVNGPVRGKVSDSSDKEVQGPSRKNLSGSSETELAVPIGKEGPGSSEMDVSESPVKDNQPSGREGPQPTEKIVQGPSGKELDTCSEKHEQRPFELSQTPENESLSKDASNTAALQRSISQMQVAIEKLRNKKASLVVDSGNQDTANVADCDNENTSIPTDNEIAMQPSPVARSRSVSSNALQTSTDELTDTDLQIDAVGVQINSDQSKEPAKTAEAPVAQSVSTEKKPEEEEEMVDEDLFICPIAKPPTPPLICLDDETENEPEDKNINSSKTKLSTAGPLSSKLPPPEKKFCPENTAKIISILKKAKLIPQNARKTSVKRQVRSVTSDDSSSDEEVAPRPSKVPTSGAIRTFNRERNKVVSPQVNASSDRQLPARPNERNLRSATKSATLQQSRDLTSLEDQEEEETSDASNRVAASAQTLAQKDEEIVRLKNKLKCIYSAFQLQQWKSAQEKSELKHNMNLIIMEMRASLEADKKQTIDNITQTLTQKKHQCIEETKKKQWCAFCRHESRYACCWNTSYCSISCQRCHFNEHRLSCTQLKPKLNDGSNTLNTSEVKEPKKVLFLNVMPNKDAKLPADSSKENANKQAVPSKLVHLVSTPSSQSGPSVQYMLTALKPNSSPVSIQQKASSSTENSDITEPTESKENVASDDPKKPDEHPSPEAPKEEERSLEEIYFPSPPTICFEGLDTALPDENVHFEDYSEASETELTIAEESSAEEDILLSDNDDLDQEMVTIRRGVEIKAKYLNKCLIYGTNAKKLTRCLVDVIFPENLLAKCSAFGNRSNITKLTRCALPHYQVEAIIDYVAKRFPNSSRSEITLAINMKCKEARAAAERAESGGRCRTSFRRLLAKEQQDDTEDQDSKQSDTKDSKQSETKDSKQSETKNSKQSDNKNSTQDTKISPTFETPAPVSVLKSQQPGIVRLKSPSGHAVKPGGYAPRPIFIRPNYGLPPKKVGPPNKVMLSAAIKQRSPTVKSLLEMQQSLGKEKKLIMLKKPVMVSHGQACPVDASVGPLQKPLYVIGSASPRFIAPAPAKSISSTESKK